MFTNTPVSLTSGSNPYDWMNGDFTSVVSNVCNMTHDKTATKLADKHGLAIQNVSWEDTARNKGSCFGPNISDMTLQVAGRNLPVVRHPNFADLTWDVRMHDIPLMVGNESGQALHSVTLEEYLRDFRSYMHDPRDWTGVESSLLSDTDTHALVSAQSCFLPVRKEEESPFNVCLYNYQSTAANPAVLAIVATSNGTSAQIIDGAGRSSQKLYFNKNGQKASLVAQRLTDNRRERGVCLTGAMSAEEKSHNMVMIIQVPLEQPKRQESLSFGYDGMGGNMMPPMMPCSMAPGGMSPGANAYYMQMQMSQQMGCKTRSRRGGGGPKAVSDVDHAIIKVGKAEGTFKEVGGRSIKRDKRFPVRVTLQYYKATSNGTVTEEVMEAIAEQIRKSQSMALSIGSLVVSHSYRPTEMKEPAVTAPQWWPVFWNTYKSNFPQHTETSAKAASFKKGRYLHCGMSEAETHLFRILSDGAMCNKAATPWGSSFA